MQPVAQIHPMHEDIPSNLYKLQTPWAANVLAIHRLTAADSPNEVQHIVLDLAGSQYRYLEGQSVGVLPPGTDATTGKPHKLRLYSIASAAIGDDGKAQTLTVCVKRALTTDAATGTVYAGVCSSFLCDLAVGDKVQITGPVGKSFLLPPAPVKPNLVMIATGTGIAPFRAFLDYAYKQGHYTEQTHWLFFGVQSHKDHLYKDELTAYARQHDGFHHVTAFSREETTAQGERMYVQHRLAEHGQALMAILQQPNTYVYMCGLKGMEQGIVAGMQAAAKAAGIDWETLYAQLNAEKRWHIEVY
jgi:ferredoxin--NADP+ reductase